MLSSATVGVKERNRWFAALPEWVLDRCLFTAETSVQIRLTRTERFSRFDGGETQGVARFGDVRTSKLRAAHFRFDLFAAGMLHYGFAEA